jgi:exopolysaccharide production protein ExoZ
MVGLPAIAVVAGLVAVERAGFLPEIPALKILGDASYSLYLTHTVLLSALDQLAVRLGFRLASPIADLGFGVMLLLSSLATGVLVYRWIETPLSALAGRRPLRGLPA